MTIRVKATANVFGLKRGDVVDFEESEVGPTIDALIEQGYFLWLNAPAAEPVFEVTKVVKERKPRAKKVLEPDAEADARVAEALTELYGAGDALTEHVDYTAFPSYDDEYLLTDES